MDSVFSVIGSYVDWDVRSLLLFTIVFIITADYVKNRQPDSFPPGPRALPILGNIFTLDYKKNHEFLTEVDHQMFKTNLTNETSTVIYLLVINI